MTNNSTKSRKGYLGKFTGLGLNISAEEIYSSSYAAAAYLDSIDFPKDKKVQSTLITLEQMSQKSHILLAVCHQRAFRSGPTPSTAEEGSSGVSNTGPEERC